ncbi:MAG TPA: disulfide oxidoreductase [Thermoanaerobaculia bacterium]|nr:disulfide oxidoreductase [Thermoanaerobaculia bacterium]
MFTPETVVAEALAQHPKARWVFAAYHLGGCGGCGMAGEETLGEVAAAYRFSLHEFLRDLNSLKNDTASQP